MELLATDLHQRDKLSLAHATRISFPLETQIFDDMQLVVAMEHWADKGSQHSLLLDCDLNRYAIIVLRLGEYPGTSEASRWALEILQRDEQSAVTRLAQVEAVLDSSNYER